MDRCLLSLDHRSQTAVGNALRDATLPRNSILHSLTALTDPDAQALTEAPLSQTQELPGKNTLNTRTYKPKSCSYNPTYSHSLTLTLTGKRTLTAILSAIHSFCCTIMRSCPWCDLKQSRQDGLKLVPASQSLLYRGAAFQQRPQLCGRSLELPLGTTLSFPPAKADFASVFDRRRLNLFFPASIEGFFATFLGDFATWSLSF